MPKKIGLNTTKRMVVIKNQASNLLWLGRIETTQARAAEVQKYAEKILTLAINSYEDSYKVSKTRKDANGKDFQIEVINDGAKKLSARRRIMSKLNDLQEIQGANEPNSAFRKRTEDVKHPLIEKIFNELAPKYAERAKDKGQGGGYTRIFLAGPRRGDAAEVAIIELV